MPHVPSPPPAARVATALLLLVAQVAPAATLQWVNPAGGFAGVANNWSPAQVPTAADLLRFELPNSYQVTFGANAPASAQIGTFAGDVTYRFPTPHVVGDAFAVAPLAGFASVAVRIEAGTLLPQEAFSVGYAPGTSTAVVTGNGTLVSVGGGLSPKLSVGRDSSGRLDVLDGAAFTVDGETIVGITYVGQGTLRVVGGSAVAPYPRSTFSHLDPSQPFDLGTFGGTGVCDVLDGALLDVAGDLRVGPQSTSTGHLTVSGASIFDSARVQVGGDLKIAREAADGYNGGTGTVTVGALGVVTVTGDTWLHDDIAGGAGRLEVAEQGRFATGSLHLSDPANELGFTGGRIQVLGGTLETGGQGLSLGSATGTPRLELHGGATATLAPSSGPALEVGSGGAAKLRVLGGSSLAVNDFNVVVGDNAGDDGALEVSGPGSAMSVQDVTLVGRAGAGLLGASAGAQLSLHDLAIGSQPTGDGTLEVTGSGTGVHVSGDFQLAGLSGGASGAPGRVTVAGGGELWLDAPVSAGDVWPTGEIDLQAGGTLHLAGTLSHRGTLTLGGGATSGGFVQPIAGGDVTGTGDLNSSLVALADTTGQVLATGPLQLGRSSSVLGVQFAGALLAMSHPVTLRDADSAVVGAVVLSGGTLAGPPGGTHVLAGSRITGSGTVTGAVRLGGGLLAGAPSGLSFAGTVLGAGRPIDGLRVAFQPGGGYVGYGRIGAAIVDVDSGAVVLPTDSLTVGNTLGNSTVTVNGTLFVPRAANVTLDAGDTTRVGGTVTLTGGRLTLLNGEPLWVRGTGALTGHGEVAGPVLVSGALDPGESMRQLKFSQMRLAANATYFFDVGDFHSGELDTVTVSGPAQLGGTLALRMQPGFTAFLDDSFIVYAAGSISGTFANVTLNGAPAAPWITLRYRPNAVWAVVHVNGLDVPGGGTPPAGPAVLRFAGVGSPARAAAFALDLPEAADVEVELFDVGGRRTAVLHRGTLPAGAHRFDAAPAGVAGVCFARASIRGPRGTEVRTARAVVLP